MPVDNELYDRFAATWWDPQGFLNVLCAFNPVRFGYMRRVLLEELRLNPAGCRALDVGCGGGLLAEEFARLGFAVTGVRSFRPLTRCGPDARGPSRPRHRLSPGERRSPALRR
jgi:2-polyprenyl-6-hydroxyphenyl methylase/3-demethylubiquinone-9 3-methyltransferase